MAFANSDTGRGRQLAPIMAALGVVSGTATGWIFGLDTDVYPEWLNPVALVFALPAHLLPVGLVFGAAVAAGVWLRTANPWSLVLVPIATVYAWSAAVQVAIRVQRHTGDDLYLVAASLAAGAVGAGITQLGCAPFSRELRQPGRFALTVIVGALAGLLFYAGQRKLVDERLLFLVWQPAVAFCIGLGLGRGETRRV
jgi:hypothetical protein